MNANNCAAAVLMREIAKDVEALEQKLFASYDFMTTMQQVEFERINGLQYFSTATARQISKFAASLMERERQAS